MTHPFDVIIIGGGAAGFFTAINTAEKNPNYSIAILERGSEVLTKVRISGGGRCNVTHACFEPNELVKFYPRGEKELRGPFHQFCSGDTIEWFEKHGVILKTEADGRMFPESNTSQTIIDCFLKYSKQLNITILTQQSIQEIEKTAINWHLKSQNNWYSCDKLVIATGSNPKIWELMQHEFQHQIIKPVPSLFTFNCNDPFLADLAGISAYVSVSVTQTKLQEVGNLLITHKGFSGPAVLKLSAWGARILADLSYNFTFVVNWLHQTETSEAITQLKAIKQQDSKKTISKKSPFEFPNRLWERFVLAARINDQKKWADITNVEIEKLAQLLTKSEFKIKEKSTFKEEFVTAGGLDLKEINFKTMQSKRHDNLYFAGETVNIDAITGGFNFQNAWTTGFLVSQSI